MLEFLPVSDELSNEVLEEMIRENTKPHPGGERQSQNIIGKGEFLHLMIRSNARVCMGIPVSFVLSWAGKQDWPMTWIDVMDVNAAWWRQLLAWRKEGGQ